MFEKKTLRTALSAFHYLLRPPPPLVSGLRSAVPELFKVQRRSLRGLASFVQRSPEQTAASLRAIGERRTGLHYPHASAPCGGAGGAGAWEPKKGERRKGDESEKRKGEE